MFRTFAPLSMRIWFQAYAFSYDVANSVAVSFDSTTGISGYDFASTSSVDDGVGVDSSVVWHAFTRRVSVVGLSVVGSVGFALSLVVESLFEVFPDRHPASRKLIADKLNWKNERRLRLSIRLWNFLLRQILCGKMWLSGRYSFESPS